MSSDFCHTTVCKFVQLRQYSVAQVFLFPSEKLIPLIIASLLSLLLGGISTAHATGDAAVGKEAWYKTCEHCHGRPQPNSKDAFSDYDTTANRLSVYASDPAAITKAANEGYRVPEGNTNDKVPVGNSTKEEMGSFAGMAPNKLGYGTTPSQYAMDISAFFASLFDAPGAPGITAVTAGNAQASVSFTAPKSDLTITSYTAVANPGGIQGTGTASPITVSGLTNGTTYTFKVTATSNAGTSKPSSASMAVTPIPSVATGISNAAPNTQAKSTSATVNNIAMAKPAIPAVSSNPVNQVAPNISNTKQTTQANATATTNAATISSVAPLKSASPVNSASSSFDHNGPTIISTRAGSKQAKVYFTVPAGAAATISSYTVTAVSKGVATGITATGAKSPITVPGLTNGTTYTFTVTANTSAGKSLLSAPSDSVTPLSILGD